MREVDPKDKPAIATLPEAKIVHQPNLPPNGPQPLARPISYNPPGLALLRFSATTLTMVAMAQIYVGLAVIKKSYVFITNYLSMVTLISFHNAGLFI